MKSVTLSTTILLLLPLLADAGVYKWIGPDGQIHYSDRRVSGAERVGVKAHRPPSPTEAAADDQVQDADAGLYENFEILSPEQNQTLRNAEGKVELSLLIEPALSSDHKIELILNANPVPGEAGGSQILLQGLSFGSHQVQARILDQYDEVVALTPVVDFHLRKPVPESP